MSGGKRKISGSNVAVCGGLGFLGSHLVNHLIEDRDCKVLVLDNLITGSLDFLHQEANFVWCDITQSESQIRKILLHHGIKYVFNYAAMPYIPFSFDRPLHTFDTNARGALMLFNACQDASVEAILQVSSAEIYGDAPNHKVDEKWPASPHSTYGASKLAIDALVQSRWREARTPVISLRQFNCVGERETHPYVIPEIISQINELDEEGTVYLGNNSKRDFQYAGDAVKMAVELLEKGKFGEVYNMGSEEVVKIYDLADMIAEIMGVLIRVEQDEKRIRPWEIWHLQSDNTKLYSVIDYRPKVKLKEALKLAIEDYKQYGWIYG